MLELQKSWSNQHGVSVDAGFEAYRSRVICMKANGTALSEGALAFQRQKNCNKFCSAERIENLFGWNSFSVFLMHEGRRKVLFRKDLVGSEAPVRAALVIQNFLVACNQLFVACLTRA